MPRSSTKHLFEFLFLRSLVQACLTPTVDSRGVLCEPICEQGKDSRLRHQCAEPVILNRSVAQDLGRQGVGPLVDGSVPTHLSPAVAVLNDALGNLQGSGLRFLYLFSGPGFHDGSLRDELEKLGAVVDLYDIVIDQSLD